MLTKHSVLRWRKGLAKQMTAPDAGGALDALLVWLHDRILRSEPVEQGACCHQLGDFESSAVDAADALTLVLRTLGTGRAERASLQRIARNFFDRKAVNAVHVAMDVLRKACDSAYVGKTQSLLNL